METNSKYMKIREYCDSSGFPESLLRRLCRTNKAHKFCQRTGSAVNSHILLCVPQFEKMWNSGELEECL